MASLVGSQECRPSPASRPESHTNALHRSSPTYWCSVSGLQDRGRGPGWLPRSCAENHPGPSQPCTQGKVVMESRSRAPRASAIIPCLPEGRHAGDRFVPYPRDEGSRSTSYTIHEAKPSVPGWLPPPLTCAIKARGRADPGKSVLLGKALDWVDSTKETGDSVWEI